jgi:hypothetical protein
MSENRYGALTDAGADQAPAAILCASLLRSSERTTKYIPSPSSPVLHPGCPPARHSLASFATQGTLAWTCPRYDLS